MKKLFSAFLLQKLRPSGNCTRSSNSKPSRIKNNTSRKSRQRKSLWKRRKGGKRRESCSVRIHSGPCTTVQTVTRLLYHYKKRIHSGPCTTVQTVTRLLYHYKKRTGKLQAPQAEIVFHKTIIGEEITSSEDYRAALSVALQL